MNADELRTLIAELCESDAGAGFDMYVLGGSALVLGDLQETTKDLDVCFRTERDRDLCADHAVRIGFVLLTDRVPGTQRIAADKPISLMRGRTVVDGFLRRTTHFSLSDGMAQRAHPISTRGPGRAFHLDGPDILILKSATGRPTDASVAQHIIGHRHIDWAAVVSEVRDQEVLGNRRAYHDVLEMLAEARAFSHVPAKELSTLFDSASMRFAELRHEALAADGLDIAGRR